MELNENQPTMNNPRKSKMEFRDLCHDAVNCRRCFDDKSINVRKPRFDIAQPRWVGPNYWTAHPRVLILMLNPGEGKKRKDDADTIARLEWIKFAKRSGKGLLSTILQKQRMDMEYWGKGRKWKLLDFISEMGLQEEIDEEKIAFANIAWCATEHNVYPPKMLETCFERHTQSLLKILKPKLVILSGTNTWKFFSKIHETLPDAVIIRTFHYANRETRQKNIIEQKRVKQIVQTGKRKI